ACVSAAGARSSARNNTPGSDAFLPPARRAVPLASVCCDSVVAVSPTAAVLATSSGATCFAAVFVAVLSALGVATDLVADFVAVFLAEMGLTAVLPADFLAAAAVDVVLVADFFTALLAAFFTAGVLTAVPVAAAFA